MTATIIAIDPGPEQSAVVRLNESGVPDMSKILPNDGLLASLRIWTPQSSILALEMVACYGMPVGAEVFETCVWIGRFIEAWDGCGPHELIYRRDVKINLCGNARAKDANIRQAIIDRFGGKDRGIGKKKTPGPLYGIKSHHWAALGVALTLHDKLKANPRVEVAVEQDAPTISDGHGSTWPARCPECGGLTMRVVRPGKCQCSKCG